MRNNLDNIIEPDVYIYSYVKFVKRHSDEFYDIYSTIDSLGVACKVSVIGTYNIINLLGTFEYSAKISVLFARSHWLLRRRTPSRVDLYVIIFMYFFFFTGALVTRHYIVKKKPYEFCIIYRVNSIHLYIRRLIGVRTVSGAVGRIHTASKRKAVKQQ